MARARNIKPGFFTHDGLAELEPLTRLLFIGLWTIADRSGRLEDRPKRIKAEVMPYDNCDMESMLNDLHQAGFILRYKAGKLAAIQIVKWDKHQNPHIKEVSSTIPEPCQNSSGTCQESKTEKPYTEQAVLIPPSPFPLPDSPFPIPENKRAQNARMVSRPEDVEETVWNDFLVIRKAKKAPLTATALVGIEREAKAAGLSLAEALAMCCSRGWQGFKAEWIADSSLPKAGQPAETTYQRSMRERWEEATGRRSDDRQVIDITPNQELLP